MATADQRLPMPSSAPYREGSGCRPCGAHDNNERRAKKKRSGQSGAIQIRVGCLSNWLNPSASLLCTFIILFACACVSRAADSRVQQAQQRRQKARTNLSPGNHTRNAAVLVSSSRYWHNYRHVSNVLSLYNLLKTGGKFSDDNIILMIADDIPCDGRNPHKNAIYPEYARTGSGNSVYDADVEIDYRGTDVTVESFLRVLVGRHEKGETPSRMLDLTPDTNLVVFLTGHGGDSFFKFQDGEELMTQDITDAFQQMHRIGRYKEILFIADTCQAFTLNPTDPKVLSDVTTLPNVMTVASSLQGQNSYAHHSDPEIGQSVVDRYSYNFVENLNNLAMRQPDSQFDMPSALWKSMEQVSVKTAWVDALPRKKLGADVGWTDKGCSRPMKSIPLSDFLCDKEQGDFAAASSKSLGDVVLHSNCDGASASCVDSYALERVVSAMR